MLVIVSSMLQILVWFGVLHVFGSFPSAQDALYF
jgi:hypothetical protein